MSSLSEQTRGRLYVVAASVLWSSNGLFVKSPLFLEWPHEQRGVLLAMWRAFFAALALVPLIRRPGLSLRMVPMALSFFGMSICFLQSMVWTTAANAIWLQNIAPAWVCLFTWLAGEKMDRRDLVMLGFAVVGVGTILVGEFVHTDWNSHAFLGVLLGMGSGLCYALIIHFLRRLRDFDSGWLIIVNLSTTALLLSPAPAVLGVWPYGVQWPVLAAFGALQLGLAYFCFARSLQRISGQEAAGIALLEPVLVPIWVWLRYGEIPASWTIAGGGLILLGLTWRYLPRRGGDASP
jgi:drug/metabolite transporter (DMT)-like permease